MKKERMMGPVPKLCWLPKYINITIQMQIPLRTQQILSGRQHFLPMSVSGDGGGGDYKNANVPSLFI